MELVLGLLVAALTVVPLGLVLRGYRRRRALLDELAAALGARVRETADGGREVVGERDGFGIRVAAGQRAGQLLIVLDGKGAIPYELQLRANPQPLQAATRLSLGAGFPQLVEVTGDDVAAAALLDAATRVHLVDELRSDPALVVRVGNVETVIDAGRLTAAELVRRIEQMHALGRRLGLADDERAARLAANAEEDPKVGVQRTNLALLFEHYGETETARAAARSVVETSNAELRLIAARHLGPEGLDVVEQLARDRVVAESVRRSAIDQLADAGEPERVGPVLIELLGDSRVLVREAALAAIGRIRYEPAVGELADRALADPTNAPLLAAALARLGGELAELALLELLRRGDVTTRLAAARALGECGGRDSVELLLDLSKAPVRLEGFSPLAQVARDALTRVRKRVGPADGGRLSLADEAIRDGGLSIARESGSLSVVDDGDETVDPG